jgi:proteic killer suppression protein
VELEGIVEVRKISGYHDEPLKGDRHGQRSVRLSKSYRAIYEKRSKGSLNIIDVVEVNKHDY